MAVYSSIVQCEFCEDLAKAEHKICFRRLGNRMIVAAIQFHLDTKYKALENHWDMCENTFVKLSWPDLDKTIKTRHTWTAITVHCAESPPFESLAASLPVSLFASPLQAFQVVRRHYFQLVWAHYAQI